MTTYQPNANGPTPIISRTCPDGTLIETIFDTKAVRTMLAVCRPDGTVSIEDHLELPTGERVVPYSPHNNLLASRCVLLPGDVGDFGDKGDVLEAVRTFIHRYVDLSPAFEEIATYYALLSWVYDAFNELPYLRFRGDWGTGKTRALLTVGSVSYKPFFASGASTVSPIFHVLDTFGGTLILDEADLRFSDATAELTKILNNGNVAGLPVLRTMTNRHRELNPQAFNVFGPKIIGMREHFNDQALESRFLTEETGRRSLRPDISIHLPHALREEALHLRNRLLAWRFHARHQVAIDPSRMISGIAPRFNQSSIALLSIIDDPALRGRIAVELLGHDQRVADERSTTIEHQVLSAIMEIAQRAPAAHIGLAEIARALSRKSSENLEDSFSIKTIGYVVRVKLRLPTMKSHGVYVIPSIARPAITALAIRYRIVVDADATAQEYARGA